MLADLLLGQARSAMEQSKKDSAKMAELQTKARDSYRDAIQLFAKSIEELAPKIMELRGDRAKTPSKSNSDDSIRSNIAKPNCLKRKHCRN